MNGHCVMLVGILGFVVTAGAANAAVYCKEIGVPKGCIVRPVSVPPAAVVRPVPPPARYGGAPGAGALPGAGYGTAGRPAGYGPANLNGGVNRAGRR